MDNENSERNTAENGQIISSRAYPSPNPLIRLSELTYWSDGLKVKGLLAEPKAEGKYDALLYLRGGMQNIGMVRPARIAQFASQGFIVFAPYYRGNRGGEGVDEFAGGDRWDAVYGADVLKRHGRTNGRMHVFAFSRGGLMALWTAVLRDDLTSCVLWAGVTDTILTYKERTDMRRMMKRVIGGTPNTALAAYEERNPLLRIDETKCPFLIIHGLADTNVSVEHSLLLEEALKLNGMPHETWYMPDLPHLFPPKENARTVRALADWMKKQGE